MFRHWKNTCSRSGQIENEFIIISILYVFFFVNTFFFFLHRGVIRVCILHYYNHRADTLDRRPWTAAASGASRFSFFSSRFLSTPFFYPVGDAGTPPSVRYITDRRRDRTVMSFVVVQKGVPTAALWRGGGVSGRAPCPRIAERRRADVGETTGRPALRCTMYYSLYIIGGLLL